MYWAGQLKEGKGCHQTLDCYCVSCELLSASIADAILFVNTLVSGIFNGRFAQRLAVNKPCFKIIRCLLWKQTTTHSLRNNNPMFDGNLCPLLIDQPSRGLTYSNVPPRAQPRVTTQQSGKRKVKQRTEQFGGRGSNGKGKGVGQQSSGHLPKVAHSIQFEVAPANLGSPDR